MAVEVYKRLVCEVILQGESGEMSGQRLRPITSDTDVNSDDLSLAKCKKMCLRVKITNS